MVIGAAEQFSANKPFALREHINVVECVEVLCLALFFTPVKGKENVLLIKGMVSFLDGAGECSPCCRVEPGKAAHGEDVLAQGLYAAGVSVSNAPQFSCFRFVRESLDGLLVGLHRGDLLVQEAVANLDGMARTLVDFCRDHDLLNLEFKGTGRSAKPSLLHFGKTGCLSDLRLSSSCRAHAGASEPGHSAHNLPTVSGSGDALCVGAAVTGRCELQGPFAGDMHSAIRGRSRTAGFLPMESFFGRISPGHGEDVRAPPSVAGLGIPSAKSNAGGGALHSFRTIAAT